MREPEQYEVLAAVDLGSNSFHMVVARPDLGGFQVMDRLSEKVQLAAGLDDRGRLNDLVQERALACLGRFSQHLREVEPGSMRVVATNALRMARNADVFLKKAERILGCPIEVISGREEARLIYLGVTHTQVYRGRQLVVDIGGGSTEFIIGEQGDPVLLESLHMGCVSFQRRFFSESRWTAAAFQAAVMAARQQVMLIAQEYIKAGWDVAIGSSGTMKAVLAIVEGMGWSDDGAVTRAHLYELLHRLTDFGAVSAIDFPGIKEDRKPLLAPGLSIALGFFEELGIERMYYSDGALREGVLFDMLGRMGHEDVRQRTIASMQRRYRVDVSQATQVCLTAMTMADTLGAAGQGYLLDSELLRQAAQLHEIGLGVSHSGFHKHGAYLLRYSDMPGFSRPEQERLAMIVGCHRRKIREEQYAALQESGTELILTCLVLRLAILLHHSRHRDILSGWTLAMEGQQLELQFSKGWLERHPLTLMDLQQEQEYLRPLGWELKIS